ncbi:hypothetical protein SBA4_20073 [Candidatus Sulfopaludibacter sp. SbA4]|nr:hypothetical protein SBA4_20073 [Candidatus Sulfopaludibacter sp. SbA4]
MFSSRSILFTPAQMGPTDGITEAPEPHALHCGLAGCGVRLVDLLRIGTYGFVRAAVAGQTRCDRDRGGD